MQQSHVIPSPRSFACDLATICAPTLAGLKPASLFRYQPAPGQDAAAMAAAWHAALSPRGVTVRVLRQCPRTGAVLVYVYRPARVARLLAAPHMLDFLAGEGYTPGTADELLDITAVLAKGKGYRLAEGCTFPLLGYYKRRQALDSRTAGNGRLARNTLEKAIFHQSRRLVAEPAAELDLILPSDLEFEE